jgi:nucleoside-diphosphate-sugar epimerase
VLHLLARGEDPRCIRILDIRPPTRPDLKQGKAKDVAFFRVDISDAQAVDEAFKAPWPTPLTGEIHRPILLTIFHTAANIRFYERHQSLLYRSAKVNIDGTQHIIDSARAIGASVLVYTSSGSVAVRRSRFWLWPWETRPPQFVQILNDDDELLPKKHEEFFSNYAATKIVAERAVRKADNSSSSGSLGGVLRTGCLRPGNGVYGPGGDILCGAYLVRKVNPSWIQNIVNSFIYVENCSLAHLCYERRLLDLADGHTPGDEDEIGGQAFTITDAGPPLVQEDVYTAFETLTDGETSFPRLSPTLMLVFAHILEAYYLTHYFLTTSSSTWSPPTFLRTLARRVLPALGGDVVNLQPSLFALANVHLIFDDSRARAVLGYKPLWTTAEGLVKTWQAWEQGGRKGETRSLGGGVSFGFRLVRAQRSVKPISQLAQEIRN